MTVISFDLIRACLAIPVGSGLYSASFGRSTEPRKRVSAHAETIPIAQHHCPLWVECCQDEGSQAFRSNSHRYTEWATTAFSTTKKSFRYDRQNR